MPNAPASLRAALSRLDAHPLIVAHRGDWRTLPENSVAAMLSARAIGADMVEVDAQAVADGVLVAIHDDTLDRTTDAHGAVRDLRAANLPGLRLRAAAGGADAATTGHTLPQLDALLEALRGAILINIDTKRREDLDAVAALVLRMGMQDQVLLKTDVADPAAVLRAPWFGRVAFMPICIGLPDGALVETATAVARATGARLVEADFRDLAELATLSAALAQHGAGVWVNTLGGAHAPGFDDRRAAAAPDAVWGTLIRHGVGAIQTDRAGELARHLARPQEV